MIASMDKLAELIANTTYLLRRSQLASVLDGTTKDIDAECGYPSDITTEQYTKMYQREGIARRVVSVLPDESWQHDPEVYEDEESDLTPFEEAVLELVDTNHIWHYLHRADELSGIGRFGILLIGIDDGQTLDKPVEGVVDGSYRKGTSKPTRKLVYLKAFDESAVSIVERETDTTNPRYGLPTMYQVQLQDVSSTPMGDMESASYRVHWTRVIHLADNRTTSDIYGTPRMQPVYNRLFDLRKILSGSPEMFWKGAFPGFSFELTPDAAGSEIDESSVREKLQSYMQGLQRYIAVAGMTVKQLAPQVADPKNHVETQLKAIAISLGIPFRILFGSEQAQLASEQDTRNWNRRVQRRRDKYVTPMIIRPFIDRLIAMRVLPVPQNGYHVSWPDLGTPTAMDKAKVADTTTAALQKYVAGGVAEIIPPREYMLHVLGMDVQTIDAIMDAAVARITEEEQDASGTN